MRKTGSTLRACARAIPEAGGSDVPARRPRTWSPGAGGSLGVAVVLGIRLDGFGRSREREPDGTEDVNPVPALEDDRTTVDGLTAAGAEGRDGLVHGSDPSH